jgi:cytochrome c-type biogenesis protein CcmH
MWPTKRLPLPPERAGVLLWVVRPEEIRVVGMNSFKTRLMLMPLSAALFTAVLLALLLTLPAAGQTGDARLVTNDEVNAIARELYCPVCESTPLDVCPTQACADWREVIRVKLSEGQSEEEIKAYFAEQYGPRALAEPPREGFTSMVWIVPIVAVVAGGIFFTRYMRRIKTAGPFPIEGSPLSQAPHSGADPAPDDYTTRVERELQEREK